MEEQILREGIVGKAGKWAGACCTQNPSTLNTVFKHTVYFSADHCFGYIDNILPFNKHFSVYWVLY